MVPHRRPVGSRQRYPAGTYLANDLYLNMPTQDGCSMLIKGGQVA